MNKKRKNPTIEQTQLYDRITKIQSEIIDRVTHLKKEKLSRDCRHFQNPRGPCQSYQSSTDYYQKFWKCFLLNQLCYARLEQTQKKMSQLESHITQVEKLFKDHQKLTQGKGSKRMRRRAVDIVKKHSCPYPRCFKEYGVEIALNQHIKQKHNGGNKTERENAAEMILNARERNEPIPIIYINLPPNYLEQYAKDKRLVNNEHNRSQSEIYEEGE